MVGFRNEVDKCHGRSDCQPGMPGLETSMRAVTSVAGAVQAANLGKVLGDGGQVAKQHSDRVGALRLIGDAFRDKFQLLGKRFVSSGSVTVFENATP